MSGRKLPVGIQSFEDLRRNDYLYIDKTEYIQQLLQDGKVYFLSRPRRFGKSLLISTLEAYFLGKKELFQGLAIEALENVRGAEAWTEYPVITFSLSGGNYLAPDGLEQTLQRVLEKYETEYQIDTKKMDLPNRFSYLIEAVAEKTGRQVVILVDEYDKPLLETMVVNAEQEERNRQLYKGFFSVLKDMDQYLKFVFFTGVTKFSKVSIFSDLNQLRDISLSVTYHALCGITEAELKDNFQPEIAAMAAENGETPSETERHLKQMYDGYHFSRSGCGVYNPFSLLRALQERDYGSYWFETGTPTFLIRKLEQSDYMAENLNEGVVASERSISDYRENNPDPIPLFYQSGYLTITGWNPRIRSYTLAFPNDEVKYAFSDSLFTDLFHTEASRNVFYLLHFLEDLDHGDIDAFLTRLQALFGAVPYPEGDAPQYEREWRNQIYLVFALLGQHVQCEIHTAHGRADCIVQTKDHIYVFEFKLNQDAETALQQIREKGYAVPYQTDSRKLMQIGVSFSSETRNIADWIIE